MRVSMAAKILARTAGWSQEQWVKYRDHYLGGSDVAKITGHSKYGSKITVYMEKIGEMQPAEAGEAAYWGTVMEPILATEFTKRTGHKVRKMNAIIHHPDYPWMAANVDRVLVGQDEGLELKTASEYLKDLWEGDEVPDAYYLQCQHYMAVTGASRWWIAYLIGGNKFFYKPIERDEDTISALIDIEKQFWWHVENRVPPELDGSEATTALLKVMHPSSNGEEVTLTAEAMKLIEDRETAKTNIEQWEEQKNLAENQLKALLGDCEVGRCGDKRVIWKNVTSNRFDTTTFKKDQPELYSEYAKASTSRRFEIK